MLSHLCQIPRAHQARPLSHGLCNPPSAELATLSLYTYPYRASNQKRVVFHFNPLCWRRWIGCWYRRREIRVVQMFQIKNGNGVRQRYNDDTVPPSSHMTWFSVPPGGLYSLTCFVHDIIVFRALLASIIWCWGPNSIQTLVFITIPLTLYHLLSVTHRIHSDPTTFDDCDVVTNSVVIHSSQHPAPPSIYIHPKQCRQCRSEVQWIWRQPTNGLHNILRQGYCVLRTQKQWYWMQFVIESCN